MSDFAGKLVIFSFLAFFAMVCAYVFLFLCVCVKRSVAVCIVAYAGVCLVLNCCRSAGIFGGVFHRCV